jgi:DNA polymerase III subunit delta'
MGGAAAESAAPAARANPDLVGHDAVEGELLRLYKTSRLPHAILLGGPRGIGKATLAFRFARFVLAAGGGSPGLAIDPQSGVFRRVAAGGHADLLTVERLWDAQRRRLRGEITAEQTREIAGFLHLTAGEGGWRVAIVDEAEEMNRNAANALLKILEEPPRRALLLLVSHRPGALLSTIRSRSRYFRLEALAPSLVKMLLARYRPRIDEGEAALLTTLAGGSIGRALEIADGDGLVHYRSLVEILSRLPRLDVRRVHAFVDAFTGADAEVAYRMVGELLSQYLGRIAMTGARGPEQSGFAGADDDATVRRLAAVGTPARWASLRAEIDESLTIALELNLDRKQAMLGAFFAIARAARY